MKCHSALFAAAVALSTAAVADARPNYPSQVPTPYGCETCHLDPNDRLNRNGFGIDFALERGLWVNPAQAGRGMCYLDSDFDGISNGEELDDPQCLWRPGTRLPAGPTTHPGDGRDPDQCGDGVIIPFAEECDRVLPPDETCQTRGFDEGELGCTADCYFDTSACFDLPPDMALPDPDMAPPDAGPSDGGLDAMPADAGRAVFDAIVDDSDAMVDDSDVMVGDSDAILNDFDAMPDDSDGIVDDADAMPAGSGDPPVTTEPGDGCRAAPGHTPTGWLWLLGLIGLVRRR